jgi:dCTP deaminase
MGFWSGAKLAKEILSQEIVAPFRAEQIDCSAYTLTMGREYYVTPSDSLRFQPHIKQGLDPSVEIRNELGELITDAKGNLLSTRGGSFSIPPGQFGLLLTEEFIRMPDKTMGFISLKSHAKFQGIINVSGFHVDPGFQGHLIFSVFNAGPSTVTFERGQPLFLLWIADLTGGGFQDYSRKDKPPLVDISAEVISRVPGDMVSLQSLSERLTRAEALTVTLRTAGFALIYSIGTVLALLFALTQLTNVRIDISLG